MPKAVYIAAVVVKNTTARIMIRTCILSHRSQTRKPLGHCDLYPVHFLEREQTDTRTMSQTHPKALSTPVAVVPVRATIAYNRMHRNGALCVPCLIIYSVLAQSLVAGVNDLLK